MRSLAALAGLTLCASFVNASDIIPFDSPRWQISAEEQRIEEYKGKTSLLLRGGLALIADADLEDGVIEFFCAVPEARGFAGATWRVQDAANREEFYIRPHQSGNPDANQYTPVFNGLTAWQLYHGEGYGAPVAYEFDTWFPVRIVVSGRQAEVYITDLEKPALFIDNLKRDVASGAVGLSVADFGAARFADFRFEVREKPELKGRMDRERTAPEGAVLQWQVSSSFAEQKLDGLLEIGPRLVQALQWATLSAEPTGLANLSRMQALTREANTVLARVVVVSEGAQAKTIAFGYSDRLRLFLNGHLVYTGNNGYRTRDYRYLGTIGYFDAVTLSLEKGRNELLFAVSESFGGWGMQAAFSDTEGLTMVQ